LQDNGASKIDEYFLLGVNSYEENVIKSYIIGFANSSFSVDDNCPYNLVTSGLAGKAEQIENVQEYLNKVYECSKII